MALLTSSGRPFLAYCSLWPEGRDPYPSLGSLLRAVAASVDDGGDEVEGAADDLERRVAAQREGAEHTVAGGVAPLLRSAGDERFGGLRELPKHPRPALWWRALAELGDPPVREQLVRTLDAMQAGGILDQLDDSFHRCARDERWVVPHFEKLAPLNAGLAAVYARAARLFDRPDYSSTAEGAAAFALAALEHGTLAVSADADHYTWKPQQVYELLEPALVQVVGLHFNVTRDASPHVLFRALGVDAMRDYADESPTVLAERLERGKALLRMARSTRTAPEGELVSAPAWHAETLRWLFEAAAYGIGVNLAVLDRHLDAVHMNGPAPEPSRDLVDHVLCAAVPAIVSALRQLAASADGGGPRERRERFRQAAAQAERYHREALRAAAPADA